MSEREREHDSGRIIFIFFGSDLSFFTSCIIYFLFSLTLSLSSSSFLLSFLPLVDFVLGTKGTPLLEQYDQWRAWADEKVCSDYSFHVAVTWWSEEVSKEMEILAKEKGVGFCRFLLIKSFFPSFLSPLLHSQVSILSRCSQPTKMW